MKMFRRQSRPDRKQISETAVFIRGRVEAFALEKMMVIMTPLRRWYYDSGDAGLELMISLGGWGLSSGPGVLSACVMVLRSLWRSRDWNISEGNGLYEIISIAIQFTTALQPSKKKNSSEHLWKLRQIFAIGLSGFLCSFGPVLSLDLEGQDVLFIE